MGERAPSPPSGSVSGTQLLKDVLEIAQLCLPRYIGPPPDDPRLELMATALDICCLQFVRTQLHLLLAPQDTLRSNSQCVIGLLRSPHPHMPVFVANRLRTIRTHTATIRFVASSDNPADLPSRVVPPPVLATEKKWWQEPDWLSLPAIEWPTLNVTLQPLQDVPSFPTTPSVVFKTKLLVLDRPVENSILVDLLARVSTLSRSLRTTPWIQRFLQNARQPQLRQQAAADLTAQELACSTRGNTLSFVNWTSSLATTVCFGAVDV